jgi:glutathione peroxidase
VLCINPWLNRSLLNKLTFEYQSKKNRRMTTRQKVLKLVYPLLVKLGKLKAQKQVLTNEQNKTAMKSFYDLSVQLNTGKQLSFDSLKGKKVLLVNTASNCGYTNQYAELQNLFEKKKNSLVKIVFPDKDFK